VRRHWCRVDDYLFGMEDPYLATMNEEALIDAALAMYNEEMNPGKADAFEPKVVYLPCGDIHICRGPRCEHLELNDDKCYVCRLSGICYGHQSLREDYSTGRQAGSTNPDDHAGEPVGGQWKPKKDMHAMSTAAHNAAQAIDPCEAPPTPIVESRDERQHKRGARCVDDPTPEPAQKRPRRRTRGTERERFRALQEDAENTLCKLVNFDKRGEARLAKQARDPRLMDRNALFEAAIKKYTKECIASGTVPTLDAVHNIALAAANIAAEERRKADAESVSVPPILRVRMREQVTSLACSLWNASCATPYMEDNRRAQDSFRPFVCGVLYALKRGVSLPNGRPVVPTCPLLADALPALRATAANSVAKTLHASSHRGLCTLHRSITSCSPEQATELYENCARLASVLHGNVKAGAFDL
jgi:hypothetical protein